jgi:hypothetical protein
MEFDIFYGYPRTRPEALLSGDMYYFSGKPCKHGHIAPRFTSTRACSECNRLRAAKVYYTAEGFPEGNPNLYIETDSTSP